MEKKTIEAAENYYNNNTSKIPVPTSHWLNSKDLQILNFIAGAEWYAKNQSEQMYSEEDVNHYVDDVMGGCSLTIKEWKESKK